MGDALFKVAEQLDISILESRACLPVLVLISDGYPSDDFESGFKALTAQPWGKKAVRLAIGIGGDAPYELLQRFIGNQEIKVIHAANLDNIMSYIKWADDTEVIGYLEVF